MNQLSKDNQLPAMVLIGLGAFFLLSQVFGISLGATLWPFFVIVPGLPFLYFAFTGSKRHAGLIFPGLITVGTGLILLYQNTFNHYESWAYMWALYPVLIGMGLTFLGRRTGKSNEIEVGQHMVRGGLLTFAVFAFLFEFLIFGSGFGLLGGMFLPFVLIVAGLLMWKRGGSSHKGDYEKAKNDFYEEKPKRSRRDNGHSPAIINEELQRRIDEALAEDSRHA